MSNCALDGCSVDTCPVCRWTRPSAPGDAQRRAEWLLTNGYSPADVQEISDFARERKITRDREQGQKADRAAARKHNAAMRQATTPKKRKR